MLGLHHAPSIDPVATTALVHHMSCTPTYDGAWSHEQTPARRLESLINVLSQAYHSPSPSASSSDASSPSLWRHWREEGGRMDAVKCLFLLSRMLREDALANERADKVAMEARKNAALAVVVIMMASTARAGVDERKEMATSWTEIVKKRDNQDRRLVVILVKDALGAAQQEQQQEEEEVHPLLTVFMLNDPSPSISPSHPLWPLDLF
jgi:hypothetical protein